MVLPPEGTVLERLRTVLADHGIAQVHSDAARVEAARWVAAPEIDDPSLLDLTALPFVTIDNAGSRDLDQAMHIEPANDGFRVRYALADASFFVRPGGALYAEAKRRGVTFYLPGLAIPMLPRGLSEGVVSLNPRVDRRALVMDILLDGDGRIERTSFVRARIRSRAQLTYGGVQSFFDAPDRHALAGQPFTETLWLLAKVGSRRIALADERNVVRYNRIEVSTRVDPDNPDRFVVDARVRNDVERYNEQISLLCNAEGARFMAEPGRAPHITPIFRVHPQPSVSRREGFRQLSEAVTNAHALNSETWTWRSDVALADFLAGLPVDGPRARVASALQRQAIMINQRSVFSAEPGLHHGVGVEPYARFSSPMREMVGIFTHKEAIEKLTGTAPSGWPAAARQEQAEIVSLANRTRDQQNRVAKAADLLVLDQFLQDDLQRPVSERPRRTGTVMGVTATKLYVQLDSPPLDLKVRLDDLDAGDRLIVDASGVSVSTARGAPYIRLGDAIVLRLDRREGRRYVFVRVG